MFILETAVILFSVLAIIAVLLRNALANHWIYALLVFATAAAALHWWLGETRWQLVPVYFAVLLTGHWGLMHVFASVRFEKISRVTTLILAPLAIVLTLFANWAFPMFQLPAPSGPNAFGYREFHLIDQDRPEDMSADASDVREVIVKVWYPAEPDADAIGKPYWKNADVMSAELVKSLELPLPSFLLSHLDQIETHAIPEAALKTSDDELPVLVYSHGSGLYAEQSTILMEELASHGYVIFAIDHPYNSLATIYPNGRIITSQEYADGMGVDPMGRYESIPEVAKLSDELYEGNDRTKQLFAIKRIPEIAPGLLALERKGVNRLAADQMLVLDKIEALNLQHGDMFEHRLDVQHVGVFGFSSGGYASHQTCLVDQRCTAGINIDGMSFSSLAAPALEKPFMFITHIEHTLTDILHEKSRAPVYSARLADTTHPSFTDLANAANLFTAFGYFGDMPAARKSEIENLYVRSFFDKHVKGETMPFLDQPSKAFPDVQYKVDNIAATP
jgi:predicted dienelactone hydrolase